MKLPALLASIFRCPPHAYGRVYTLAWPDGQRIHYTVCRDCGAEWEYDLDGMRRIRRVSVASLLEAGAEYTGAKPKVQEYDLEEVGA